MSVVQKILVVRNDKIGDFMLAWPAFAMLKASLNCEIAALVPSYTKPLAELCPFIDKVIVDTGKKADKATTKQLITTLRTEQFDAAICYFSTTYNAKLMWQARIPQRWAPATKLAQIFYNNRLKQRRSQSKKPEFEYNLDLSRAFLAKQGVTAIEPQPPYFRISEAELTTSKEQVAAELGLDISKQWVMVHAGSGGSANNLSAEQYAQLIDELVTTDAELILTAGPGEVELAKQVQVKVNGKVFVASGYSLPDFCKLLACADVFIAGSTGPLHIAAALDVPTVGFFPMRRSATPLRWRPLNSEGRHIAFHPPAEAQVEDMSSINVQQVSTEIRAWMAELNG